MGHTETVAVCPETLAGRAITLTADPDGGFYCEGCGATLAVITATAAQVQADWQAGGTGYRKPRDGERTKHWED